MKTFKFSLVLPISGNTDVFIAFNVNILYLFEWEFYDPVKSDKVMLNWSVYLLTLFLVRLNPLYLCTYFLGINQYLCTYFCQ